jgi:WD40 repeat protein
MGLERGSRAVPAQRGDASIGQVAFSSDGARLLTGGADGTLRIWQVKTGQEMMTLRGHDRGIGSIALSPNDDAFATNGHDGVLRLWRVATPQMVEDQLKDAGLEAGLRSIRAGMVSPSAPGTVTSSKKP